MKRTLFYCSFVMMALVAVGCGGDGDDGQCRTNLDCADQGASFICDVTNAVCVCVPDCSGKCCGEDGCGGQCSDNCGFDGVCDTQTCQCQTDTCSSDAQCENLGANYVCDDGNCVCEPDCEGKCCGDDGCGGQCSDNCADEASCNTASCQCELDPCTSDEQCSDLGQDAICDNGTCILCEASTGVGDSCNLDTNTCSCDNACGQAAFGSDTFSDHYCYEKCNQTSDCSNPDDVCMAFDETSRGCIPTGTFGFLFETKVLPLGAQAQMSDILELTGAEATLAGNPLDFTHSLGVTVVSSGAEYVFLLLFEIDWQGFGPFELRVIVPTKDWEAGRTLELDLSQDVADFESILLESQDDRMFLRGFGAVGTLTIDSVDNGIYAGKLELGLIGFSAEYDTSDS